MDKNTHINSGNEIAASTVNDPSFFLSSSFKIFIKKEPKIIISVACERDLSSGIADVGRIPVIGIVNDRPNGPCYNTNVDVDAIRNKLESIINEKE